jgi:hypothetical protein
VLLPEDGAARAVDVNGRPAIFAPAAAVGGAPALALRNARWGAANVPRFGRAEPLCAGSEGASPLACEFSVPLSVLDQLTARNESFPLEYDLDPEARNDANTAWLAPGRLLIWVKYQGLLDHALNVSGEIDGRPLLVRKAYNSIEPIQGRFLGHFVDATPHIRFGERQTISLRLPALGWYVWQGNFHAQHDLVEVMLPATEARAACEKDATCVGYTLELDGVKNCEDVRLPAESVRVWFKRAAYLNLNDVGPTSSDFCSFFKPPTLVGVFFENVETIFTDELRQDEEAVFV